MTEFLDAFTSSVSFAASIVSIGAVTICSMLTAYISQRGARRVKQTELVFSEMTSSYYAYLTASSELTRLSDQAQLSAYIDAYGRSMLFASKKTAGLLELHKAAIFDMLEADAGSTDAERYAIQAGNLRKLLTASMQKDLKKS